jgi:hypothetical protein
MKRDPFLLVAALASACVAPLFIGQAVAPDLPPYGVEGAYLLRWLSTLIELPTLTAGALFARRAARGFGEGNPAGRAWRLLALWMAFLALGQVAFSVYPLILRQRTPLPSAGDALYLAGYAAMITGILAFHRAYSASGLTVGTTRARTVVLVAASVAVVEAALLAPVAIAGDPWMTRAMNAAYPLLDGVALVALVVLARTVRSLRGGRVWRVWVTMLGAIALTCAGDLAFAYFVLHEASRLEPIVNLAFMASYALAARSAYLQDALLRTPRPLAAG